MSWSAVLLITKKSMYYTEGFTAGSPGSLNFQHPRRRIAANGYLEKVMSSRVVREASVVGIVDDEEENTPLYTDRTQSFPSARKPGVEGRRGSATSHRNQSSRVKRSNKLLNSGGFRTFIFFGEEFFRSLPFALLPPWSRLAVLFLIGLFSAQSMSFQGLVLGYAVWSVTVEPVLRTLELLLANRALADEWRFITVDESRIRLTVHQAFVIGLSTLGTIYSLFHLIDSRYFLKELLTVPVQVVDEAVSFLRLSPILTLSMLLGTLQEHLGVRMLQFHSARSGRLGLHGVASRVVQLLILVSCGLLRLDQWFGSTALIVTLSLGSFGAWVGMVLYLGFSGFTLEQSLGWAWRWERHSFHIHFLFKDTRLALYLELLCQVAEATVVKGLFPILALQHGFPATLCWVFLRMIQLLFVGFGNSVGSVARKALGNLLTGINPSAEDVRRLSILLLTTGTVFIAFTSFLGALPFSRWAAHPGDLPWSGSAVTTMWAQKLKFVDSTDTQTGGVSWNKADLSLSPASGKQPPATVVAQGAGTDALTILTHLPFGIWILNAVTLFGVQMSQLLTALALELPFTQVASDSALMTILCYAGIGAPLAYSHVALSGVVGILDGYGAATLIHSALAIVYLIVLLGKLNKTSLLDSGFGSANSTEDIPPTAGGALSSPTFGSPRRRIPNQVSNKSGDVELDEDDAMVGDSRTADDRYGTFESRQGPPGADDAAAGMGDEFEGEQDEDVEFSSPVASHWTAAWRAARGPTGSAPSSRQQSQTLDT